MYQTKNIFAGFFRKTALSFAGLIAISIVLAFNNKAEYSGDLPFWGLIAILSAIIIVLFGLAFFAHTFYTKCPHCGKKMAMQTQNKQQVGVDYEQRQVGKEIKTYKVTTYHTHRVCKFCKGEDYVETTKKESWK